MITDKEFLAANAHIPDAEIVQDIDDTIDEIMQMEAEADHLEKTPLTLPSARLDHMRAAARRRGITERQAFIDKLQRLLRLRSEADK